MSRQQQPRSQGPAAPAPAAAAAAARRSSLGPNPADDASDLIVDWDHRHRASVTYGGEEDPGAAAADETTATTGHAQSGRPNGAAAAAANAPAAAAAAVAGIVSERQALCDRIGALAAAAGPGADGVSSSAPPTSTTTSTTTTTTRTDRRTVHFNGDIRILLVEGRHHYAPREAAAAWYDAADAAAMRQAYAADVRTMRRRIRRDVGLGHHTYDVHGGNYSERGLEHLVSTAVYQERTADQSGTVRAVLAAQEDHEGVGGGGDGTAAAATAGRAVRRSRRGVERGGATGGEDAGVGRQRAPDPSSGGGGGWTDQLARMYREMSRETRERAEELGRADAEEAWVVLRHAEENDGGRWRG